MISESVIYSKEVFDEAAAQILSLALAALPEKRIGLDNGVLWSTQERADSYNEAIETATQNLTKAFQGGDDE